MVSSLKIARLALSAALLAFALGAAPRPASALTGEEAAARIEADYGVKALRVRPGTIDGTAVWLVTVMKPGGDSNDAFQVTILAVDRVTGALVPAFRHGVNGPAPLRGTAPSMIERRPGVLRSGDVWR
ncbi:MAG: hypothetical protein IID48_06075 [Proteobacteria bacterium]|nr:hypothetical protein [Pseudomonadota bacterium]